MPLALAKVAISQARRVEVTASLSRTKSPTINPKLSSPPPIKSIFGYSSIILAIHLNPCNDHPDVLVSLYYYNIEGVLLAIAITPIVQFLVLIFIFGDTLKDYIIFKKLSFKTPLLKALLGFALMSFVGTVFLNFIEIELRTLISDRVSENEAGVWTAMSSISKIYMQFLVLYLTNVLFGKLSSE